MDCLSQEQIRKWVGDFFIKHESNGKIFTVKHFVVMGLRRTSDYRMLTIKSISSMTRKRGSSEKNVKMALTKLKQLKKAIDNKKGVSLRKLARKFKVAFSTVNHSIRKININYFKRKKC